MASSVRRSRAARKNETQTGIAPAQQRQWIETAAYFKAQARGFEPGRELDDRPEAEREALVSLGQ